MIQPTGYTWFIDHYNSLIDELVENGITPYVTLLHFDLPQGLEDKYLGPLNRSFVDDFKAYTEICFTTFGDRVKNWITINEQLIIAKFGYDYGIAAPGRCSISAGFPCSAGNSATEPYIVSHNLLLAHATVVELHREKFQEKQGGESGISLVGQFVEPYSESSKDRASATAAIL
ncbi:LOW QUALITY PROTEIN: beta-glucosidase 32-like [Prunus avium]|uniref:LOW QUALITY PROTEIN: beta-glucosidase 32-like n=1 Tax=Prunus avium TaxID=42229 RepID=A0A6P5T8B3_PRUAV|nr:LOW QUALITY PROTEIN: beta-glucosidase 32-like [Prunus avium]